MIDFSSIRSYEDKEVPAVLWRLSKDKGFLRLLNYFMQGVNEDKLIKLALSVKTIEQFQRHIIYPIAKSILKNSIKQLTYEGLENIDKNQSYLYISNHRDIILDSAILNMKLIENGYDTTEIAIGSNLLIYPWITDVVKLNRSFIVNRNIPGKGFYNQSLTLSAYIQHTLSHKKRSIWIAQREGRSKDGNDRTQPGLLKMLVLYPEIDDSNILEKIKKLNIVPVSISYEYDPCDVYKTNELYVKSKGESYIKSKKDDIKNMISGLSGNKGNVHLSIGKPINNELSKLKGPQTINELIKNVAELIDKEIHKNYKIFPTNYIAFDMLNETSNYLNVEYTKYERDIFIRYMNSRLSIINNDDSEELKKIFLGMYAIPLKNKLNYIS